MGTDLEVFHDACRETFVMATALITNAKEARKRFPPRPWVKPLSKLECSDMEFHYNLSIQWLKLGVQDLYPLVMWMPDTAFDEARSGSDYDRKTYFDFSPTTPIGLPSAQYHRCVREFSKVCLAPVRLGPLYATSYHEAAIVYSLRVINAACCDYWGGSLLDLAAEIRQTPREGLKDFLDRWRNQLKAVWDECRPHPGYGYWLDGYLLDDGDVDSPTGDHSYEVNKDQASVFEMAMKKELYAAQSEIVSQVNISATQNQAKISDSPDGPIKPDGFRWGAKKPIDGLTPTEFDLLEFIFDRRDNPPTLKELKRKFWPDSPAEDGSFHKFASALRAKLAPLGIGVFARRKMAVIRPIQDGKKKSVRDI